MEQKNLEIELNSLRRAFVTANYMYIYFKVVNEDGYSVLIPEKNIKKEANDYGRNNLR